MSKPFSGQLIIFGVMVLLAIVVIFIGIGIKEGWFVSKPASKEGYIFSEYDAGDLNGCVKRFMQEYDVCVKNGDPLGDCWDMTKNKLQVCQVLW